MLLVLVQLVVVQLQLLVQLVLVQLLVVQLLVLVVQLLVVQLQLLLLMLLVLGPIWIEATQITRHLGPGKWRHYAGTLSNAPQGCDDGKHAQISQRSAETLRKRPSQCET